MWYAAYLPRSYKDVMSKQLRPDDLVRIVGICGSLRSGSHTRMAVNIPLRGTQQIGVETKLTDLREDRLIFCDGEEEAGSYPDDVHKLRQDVRQAQGIILGTPEYHGSFSGVLKNALDLMGFDELEGKIIGLVGVSGEHLGALNALNGLRTVGRALHAWVIPEQASIPTAWQAFDDEGNLKDSGVAERVLEVGRQVARFSYLHTSERALEFLRLWEGAPLNPGGGRQIIPARELEVLRLTAASQSNREIAGALVISEGTVKTHTNNIFTWISQIRVK